MAFACRFFQTDPKTLLLHNGNLKPSIPIQSGSRTAASIKMEGFVIIVNGWKPLAIITKRSILDVAAVLDLRLSLHNRSSLQII